MCLVRAAAGLMALSMASGPSSRPPLIWPRSAILHSAAASKVEGMAGLTTSTALRMATLGSSIPMAWHSSMAFWQMSAFSASVGEMLMAASVMNSGLG